MTARRVGSCSTALTHECDQRADRRCRSKCHALVQPKKDIPDPTAKLLPKVRRSRDRQTLTVLQAHEVTIERRAFDLLIIGKHSQVM